MGDKGEGGIKNLKQLVTSFMDGPTVYNSFSKPNPFFYLTNDSLFQQEMLKAIRRLTFIFFVKCVLINGKKGR